MRPRARYLAKRVPSATFRDRARRRSTILHSRLCQRSAAQSSRHRKHARALLTPEGVTRMGAYLQASAVTWVRLFR